MKTSIIVSSAAALCLMITIAENPANRNSVNENSVAVSLLSNFTGDNSIVISPVTYSINTRVIHEAYQSANNTDLSYLEFDVTDYMNEEEMVTSANEETTFDYLKFNPADYSTDAESGSADEMELPENDFGYLKFDVNAYSDASDEGTFDYLKFNVADYISDENFSSAEEIELPVNDFEYLKFDVNSYTNSESASEITELPEDDFSYLIFDVNKYTNEYLNTASAEEMPAADQN